MILKIRIRPGYDDARQEVWRFIDGVTDLEARRESRSTLVEKFGCSVQGIVVGIEWVEQELDADFPAADLLYAQLAFTNYKGGLNIILTACPTYLLNDSGKTIERLI